MGHIFMLMPLLALFLFVLLPWQVALSLYVPIALGSLAIARKAMQAQRRPPVSGREAMPGKRAVVTSVGDGQAEVHYQGETWQAVSSQSLQPGAQVLVEAVEGLALRVAPEDVSARTETGGIRE